VGTNKIYDETTIGATSGRVVKKGFSIRKKGIVGKIIRR
jgi:hypothetical protein